MIDIILNTGDKIVIKMDTVLYAWSPGSVREIVINQEIA